MSTTLSSSVIVPIARPPSYAPAWAEKPPGLRVVRTLDLGDYLASIGQHLFDVRVELEAPLIADDFEVGQTGVTFFLTDSPAAAPYAHFTVRFVLTYSGGGQDEVIVRQPIGVAAPTDLTEAGTGLQFLAVGGQLITIGGLPIRL